MQTAVTCYDAGMTDGLPHFQNGFKCTEFTKK